MNKDGFPLDILEEITDALANLDSDGQRSASLMSFSLVCHATLPLCRKHIFASVTIDEDDGDEPRTFSSLFQMLTESPELGQYIRTLIFNPDTVLETRGRTEIFKKLTRLTSLELCFWNMRYPWEDYRQDFLPLLHLPTIVQLKLSDVFSFFLSDLTGCLGLKQLEIASVTFSSQKNDIPSMISPYLSSMAIKVKVPDRWFSLQTCHRLIDTHIESADKSSSFAGLFNIMQGSLRTLKHLRVEFPIGRRPTYRPDPFSGLCQELGEMSSRNVLDRLEIKIIVPADHHYIRDDEWEALENVLMANGLAFPALRQISLTLKVAWPEVGWAEELSRHFQKLASCPTVDFNFQVDLF